MLTETTRTNAVPATTVVDAPEAPERSPRCRGRVATRKRLRVLIHVGLIFASCAVVFPLLFMVFSSFKEDHQIFADLSSLKALLPTSHLSLDNYSGVFERVPAVRFTTNSLVVTVAIVLLGLIVNSMIGFAISCMRWGGRNAVLPPVPAILIIPSEATAVLLVHWVVKLPSLQQVVDGFLTKQGMFNTYQVQTLPFVTNALSILLFAQHSGGIPKGIDETARADGASWWVAYSRIIAPLSGPTLVTVAIITMLPAQNSYLRPFIVIQEESIRSASVGMQYFFQFDPVWGQIMVRGTLITLPILIILVLLQRSLVASLAGTTVKG